MQSVCFTGACPNMTRDELSAKASGKFEVKAGVTKDLDILVCADPNSGSSKLEKAKKNGTRVIGYAEFIEMLAGPDRGDSAGPVENPGAGISGQMQAAIQMSKSTVIDGIIYSSDMTTVKGVADKGIKTAAIPEGVMAVAMMAFADCTALEEISIPDSMADIKKSAFKNCTSLLTVRLSDNVENLSSSWFCALTTKYELVCTPGSVSYSMIKRSATLKAHVKELALNEAKSEKLRQFNSASLDAIASAVVSETEGASFRLLSARRSASAALFKVGKNAGAFRFGTDSEKWLAKIRRILEILGDQEKDGAEIFAELKAGKTPLADLASPNHYTRLDGDEEGNLNLFTNGTMRNCYVTAANTLTLYGMKSLGSDSFGRGFANAFWNLVLVDAHLIGDDAFDSSPNLASVSLPEGLLHIMKGAFKGCDGLKSVRLPESLTTLGESAFQNCTNLTEIYIPRTIEKVGPLALKNTGIENLGYSLRLKKRADGGKDEGVSANAPTVEVEFTIRDGFAYEDDALLYGTLPRKNLVLPDGITEIGRMAFLLDERIESVFIPKSVKKIGNYAFMLCSSVREISFGGTVAEWAAVKKGPLWKHSIELETVRCSDGEGEI